MPGEDTMTQSRRQYQLDAEMQAWTVALCLLLAGRGATGLGVQLDYPGEEGELFEGDIILLRGSRGFWPGAYHARLWPRAEVSYEFSEEFTSEQERVVEAAIADLQKESCVRFLRWTPKGTGHRVRFRNTNRGCASLVGFQPRSPVADVFLSFPGCAVRGTIQHELLHVLGLWHEHTRHDRDRYVSVLWPNIARERRANFEARASEDPRLSGLGYDYASVMHYRALAFSKDKTSVTLEPREKNALTVMGQRERFSSMDLAKLNRLYACSSHNSPS